VLRTPASGIQTQATRM